MATVPNRYYNSPWIADAARNLASALAPTDPDVQRARDQRAYEFDTLKQKTENEFTDRANSERSRAAVGKMYDLQRNPIMGADGKPDQKATEAAAFSLADEAMHFGPKDVRAEVDDALFNLSPTFARKKILQTAAINAQSDRLGRSLAGALDQIGARGNVQQGLQDDQQAFEMERLQKQMDLRLREWNFRANAAAAKAGQQPLVISKQLGQEIMNGILRRERATGNKLTDEDRFALMSEISQDTQSTRDPYASTQNIWNKHFPQAHYRDAATQEVPEADSMFNNMFNNMYFTDTYLKPGGENPGAAPAAAPPAAGPPTLGDAATTPPPPAALNPFTRNAQEVEMMNASNAAAAADTAKMPLPSNKPAATTKPTTGKKPKEGDRSKSKSGKPMVFRKGRWEYE